MSPGWVYPEKAQPRGPMRLLDLLVPATEPAGHRPPAMPDIGHDCIDIIKGKKSTLCAAKKGQLALENRILSKRATRAVRSETQASQPTTQSDGSFELR